MSFKMVSSNELFRCKYGECVDDIVTAKAEGISYYQASHGLLYSINAGSHFKYGAAQLDGRWMLKDNSVDWYSIALGDFGYDLLTNKLMLLEHSGYPLNGDVYLMDWEVAFWLGDDKITTWDLTDPLPKPGMIRLSDRYLYATVYEWPYRLRIRSCPLDRSTDWATEYEEPDYSVTRHGTASITPAKEGGNVWICDRNGNAVRYDTQHKEITSDRRGCFRAPDGDKGGFPVSFVKDLGVFVGYHRDGTTGVCTINVYVPEVEPYSLSDPITVSPPLVGHVATVQVTLTGQDGEAIPLYKVNWTILSGDGKLSASQSLTDDDGVAETLYLPATTDTSFEIKAEVLY